MTSANVIDASRQNHHEKSPEEIQLEIARTRSAITEDLLALSEKLSPQHLREGAREVMKDAREEAKEILREAKDVAIGSLLGMKDRAVESVTDRVNVLSAHAKQAGSLTVNFVTANAVALSLFGLGTGWLLLALRNRRLQQTEYAYQYQHYAAPIDEPFDDRAPARRGALEPLARTANRATHAVDVAREQVRSRGAQLAQRSRGRLERGGGQWNRAASRTREVASNNHLGVIALTVAAGLGLGLLFPAGGRSRRALRGAGERVWDEAQILGRQVGSRTRRALSSHEEPALSNWRVY